MDTKKYVVSCLMDFKLPRQFDSTLLFDQLTLISKDNTILFDFCINGFYDKTSYFMVDNLVFDISKLIKYNTGKAIIETSFELDENSLQMISDYINLHNDAILNIGSNMKIYINNVDF